MKRSKPWILSVVLIITLFSSVAYAAYGSVSAVVSGSNKTTGNSSSGFYNNVTYTGDAKETLADADRVKNIYVRTMSSIGGVVYGDKDKTEHNRTHTTVSGSYSRKVDTNKKASVETLARARYTDDTVSESTKRGSINIMGVTETFRGSYEKDQNLLNETYELKEKELKILEKSGMNTSQINISNKSRGLLYISALDVNDYPEYRSKYIDYMIDHVHVGDYIPSGLYVDEVSNVVHFVSISDNQVYTYNLD